MNLVIMAAGLGTRLVPINTIPKGLIPIGNKTIIEGNIEIILDATDIEKIVIVTNKKFRNMYADFLKGFKQQYEIVVNEYVERGNGYSLFAAREAMSTDQFILIMSDHYFSRPFVQKAIVGEGLAVDRDPIYIDIDDATKVLTDSKGHVRDIGKKIRKYNCFDTGFFIMGKSIFKHASAVEKKRKQFGLSKIIKETKPKTVDVTRELWVDIDNLRDLEYAREHVLG